MELLKNCMLCPRKCGVNRYKDKGVCGATNKIKLGYYSLHMWEEPVISGKNGSGTIFFSNCNMKCIYCQNKKISLDGYGKYISNKKLGEIMLLHKLKGNSLNIPVVYNTSSYENVGTIMIMRNLVDIYLADLRYYDDTLAKNYSKCDNYFENATMAIDEMYRQVEELSFSEDGLLKKGLIVRVLILPGHTDDSKKIIKYLYKTYGDNIFISLMNQYTPVNTCIYNNLNRKLTKEEYDDVVKYALELGITNAFVQEDDTANESFIPNFDKNVIK